MLTLLWLLPEHFIWPGVGVGCWLKGLTPYGTISINIPAHSVSKYFGLNKSHLGGLENVVQLFLYYSSTSFWPTTVLEILLLLFPLPKQKQELVKFLHIRQLFFWTPEMHNTPASCSFFMSQVFSALSAPLISTSRQGWRDCGAMVNGSGLPRGITTATGQRERPA